MSGATLISGAGTDRVWSMTLSQFKSLNPTITGSAHYAGEVAYTVKMITTDNDGATHTDTYALKTLVTPISEGTLTNASATVYEDTKTQLTATLSTDGDTDESITQVKILKSEVDGQPYTLYVGNALLSISCEMMIPIIRLTVTPISTIFMLNTAHNKGTIPIPKS